MYTFEITKDSNEVYHKEKIDYISSSQLKQILKSPLHYKEEEKEETAAIIFGTMYHTFILEPDKFDSEYFYIDDSELIEQLQGEGFKSPRSTKKYKEWYDLKCLESQGKIIIDHVTHKQLKDMKDRLFSHPYARLLYTQGEAEQSFYIEDFNGCKCKIRPDRIYKPKRRIMDLKTCTDARPEKFFNHAYDFGYHVSAAFYCDIMEAIEDTGLPYKFYFIAQETKKPYAFQIYKASAQFLSIGRYEYEKALELYKYSDEKKKYYGYEIWCDNQYGVMDINVPAYKIKERNFIQL